MPRRISATVSDAMNRSSSRGAAIQANSDSDSCGLTTFLMMFVARRYRVTDRPCALFRAGASGRDRRRRVAGDAMRSRCHRLGWRDGLLNRAPEIASFRPFISQLARKRSDEVAIGLEGLEFEPHNVSLAYTGARSYCRPPLRRAASSAQGKNPGQGREAEA